MVTGPASAAGAGARVVGTEYDREGTKVIMREGTYNGSTRKGFGWQKVQRLHNIHSKHSVGVVIREPAPTISGTVTRYNAWAQKIRVIDGKRYIEEQVEVKVSNQRKRFAEYYGVDLDDQHPGVLTAYCENDPKADKCPSWVDLAIGRSAPARMAPVEDGVEYTGSYEPLSEGEPVPASANLYFN